jgi:hypothetical protein
VEVIMTAFRNLTLAGALGLSLLAAGCSAFDNDHHSSRDSRDDARVSRDVERESGAARSLPRDARVVDEVRGGRMSYAARDSGTVYLYDATARTIVWDGRVRDGDRVTVNPDKNRIEINGKEQADIDLKSNHRFELYSTDRSSRY